MRILAQHGTDSVTIDQIGPDDIVIITVGVCGISVTAGYDDDDDDGEDESPAPVVPVFCGRN